jgi:DNA-binding beta-propeller fold protein YncE/mono/diheme cytochrome c family protein
VTDIFRSQLILVNIIMKNILIFFLFLSICSTSTLLFAQDSTDELTARGMELFNLPASCSTCHNERGTGGIGPSLTYGPTPYDIQYQLTTNPQMGPISQQLKLSHDDLLALSVYIKHLGGVDTTESDLDAMRLTLNSIRDYADFDAYVMNERDKKIAEIESFDTVLDSWDRRATAGNIKKNYTMRTVATFEPAEPKFKPQPGKMYYYINTGAAAPGSPGTPLQDIKRPVIDENQIAVGDGKTGEIIASYKIPLALRSSSHTTAVTPDGSYIYVIGARPFSKDPGGDGMTLSSPATLLKADTLSLQPTKQLSMGGRMHHMQIFNDDYMLVDTFARDADGLDVFLMDWRNDSVEGGIRDEELGGASYTSFNDGESIYILMQPGGYGATSIPGYISAMSYNRGRYATLRPFWIARVNSKSWEVTNEYPYPGFRGDWIVLDNDKEYLYVTAGASAQVSKIRLRDGKIMWTAPTGTGPYGASLNMDESELWVADKGETTGMFGRTLSVINANTGAQLKTLFSGYQVDHVLLAPNGNEFWATSNAEGRIYIFDANKYDKKAVIDMPSRGDPHGLVWVYYDENGNAITVRDQGGFHNGVNPADGRTLNY